MTASNGHVPSMTVGVRVGLGISNRTPTVMEGIPRPRPYGAA